MIRKLTYKQLAKILALLGFEKREAEEVTLFQNDAYDAVIALPKGVSTAIVGPAHLLTVEKTITEKGVASAEKFARLIKGGALRRRPVGSTKTSGGKRKIRVATIRAAPDAKRIATGKITAL